MLDTFWTSFWMLVATLPLTRSNSDILILKEYKISNIHTVDLFIYNEKRNWPRKVSKGDRKKQYNKYSSFTPYTINFALDETKTFIPRIQYKKTRHYHVGKKACLDQKRLSIIKRLAMTKKGLLLQKRLAITIKVCNYKKGSHLQKKACQLLKKTCNYKSLPITKKGLPITKKNLANY